MCVNAHDHEVWHSFEAGIPPGTQFSKQHKIHVIHTLPCKADGCTTSHERENKKNSEPCTTTQTATRSHSVSSWWHGCHAGALSRIGEGNAHSHFPPYPPSRQLNPLPSLPFRTVGSKHVKLEHDPRHKRSRVLQARLVLNGTTVVRAASVAALPAE